MYFVRDAINLKSIENLRREKSVLAWDLSPIWLNRDKRENFQPPHVRRPTAVNAPKMFNLFFCAYAKLLKTQVIFLPDYQMCNYLHSGGSVKLQRWDTEWTITTHRLVFREVVFTQGCSHTNANTSRFRLLKSWIHRVFVWTFQMVSKQVAWL